MALNDLKGLLGRLKKFTLPDEEVRTVVVEELKKMSLDIPFEKIKVRDKVLYVDTDGNRALKNEIFMHQGKLFAVLREKFSTRAPDRLA